MLGDLKISLPLYEGPLDLLLELIRGQKLDVYDIPIAKITEQYLEYLHLMEELDVDVARSSWSSQRNSFTSSHECCSRRTRTRIPQSRRIHGPNSSGGCSNMKSSRMPHRCCISASWSKMPRGPIRVRLQWKTANLNPRWLSLCTIYSSSFGMFSSEI